MKKLILSILISAWFAGLFAQDSLQIQIVSSGSDSSFIEKFSSFISDINKTEITTGILRDKVFSFSQIEKYTGDTVNDTITDLRNWNQMYYETYNSHINAPSVPPLDSIIRSQRRIYFKDGVIPIGVINFKYNKIKETALDDNLFTISNNKLQDVQSRTQYPYDEKRVFVATAMYDQFYSTEVKFYMGQDFYYSNDTDSLMRFEVDFGDGWGFRTVNAGQTITIQYSAIGSKVITTRAIFQSKTLKSSSKFTVATAAPPGPDATWNFSSSPYTYNGSTASGKAYILYGNECISNNVLRKPIIFVEGFDPDNERDYNYLYNKINTNNLLVKLRAEGYDFVILDFDNGSDYIQRNGRLLVKLINLVNDAKASNQELIVIGASMGGLVVRYALAYMEANENSTGPHETKLMITFDSPHQGANITLGSQWWLWFFATYAGAAPAQHQVDNGNSSAAQSMILYHRNGIPNSYRTDMLNDFTAIGNYPNNLRKMAVSNGSITGSSQGFGPCTQTIHWVHNVAVFGDVVKGNVWALPNTSQSCQIFEGKVPTSFLGNTNIPTAFQSLDVFANSFPGYPYDGAPGGQLDLNQQIADGNTDGAGDITTNHPNICFIPSISSLAIQTTNVFYNIASIPGYPYPNNISITPFDVIYAPPTNEEHVFITSANILRLNDEITPDNLYLQNRTITDNSDFEARNTVTIGNDVDPVPNRQLVGDFTVESGASSEISTGMEIIVKDGTWFKSGSDAHLFIQPFACAAQCKMGSAANDTDNTIIEIPTTAEEMVFDEIMKAETQITGKFSLYAYPNPFTDHTHLDYNINQSGYVNISVFNVCGEKKAELVKENNHTAGSYTVVLDGRNLPAGLYLLIVTTESGTISKKMVKQ